MWKLVIEDDEGKRTVVPLTRDEYTIGRKEGNSIRLTERNVSRDHAKIARRAGATKDKPIFSLGDLTSYNGVYVNGIRVADKQDLANGDLIQIGDYRIVLQDEVAEAAAADDGAVPIDPEDLKETVSQGPVIPLALRATNATFLEKPNRLVVLAGPNPGEEFPLVGERLTIGRAEDATVSINHNSVSRLHCEVHSLGEGRFEIVDKGSSNGVRVNGADLRRGIIEAGDVIELGDVKFKFVGEGQIFRPGTNDSQQLAAISQRAGVSAEGVPPPRSALLPVVLFATIAAIVVIGFMLLRGGKPKPVATEVDAAPSAAADTTLADIAMLADARRMADIGQVEEAHTKANTLPPGSPLHTSADFQLVELKWAAALIFEANSSDPEKKTAILDRVLADPYVDATTKKEAQGNLATAAEPTPSGKHLGSTSSATHPGVAVHPYTPSVVAPEPPPPAPRPPPRATVSLQDLITSDNPNDVQKARVILEKRVFSNRGTPQEIRQLLSICKNQHDQTCIETCRGLQHN